MVLQSIKSNMGHVWMDCPHREKLGWMEVARCPFLQSAAHLTLQQVSHLMTPSVMYNFDASALALKLIEDIATAQLPSGLVPDIAPEYVVFGGGFRDSPEWGSALLQLPGDDLDACAGGWRRVQPV